MQRSRTQLQRVKLARAQFITSLGSTLFLPAVGVLAEGVVEFLSPPPPSDLSLRGVDGAVALPLLGVRGAFTGVLCAEPALF